MAVFPELNPARGFPMPGTYVNDEIVVASVHLAEDENFEPVEALVITLDPANPGGFFCVRALEIATYKTLMAIRFANIVEAVQCYEANGGDL